MYCSLRGILYLKLGPERAHRTSKKNSWNVSMLLNSFNLLCQWCHSCFLKWPPPMLRTLIVIVFMEMRNKKQNNRKKGYLWMSVRRWFIFTGAVGSELHLSSWSWSELAGAERGRWENKGSQIKFNFSSLCSSRGYEKVVERTSGPLGINRSAVRVEKSRTSFWELRLRNIFLGERPRKAMSAEGSATFKRFRNSERVAVFNCA